MVEARLRRRRMQEQADSKGCLALLGSYTIFPETVGRSILKARQGHGGGGLSLAP
jgi:hypothetical protein